MDSKDTKLLANEVGKISSISNKKSTLYSSTVTLSPEKDRINFVGKNKRDDIITKAEYDSFTNTIAKENLKDFIENVKNISVDELDNNKIKYAEFWDNEFNKIKKPKADKIKKSKELNLNISEEDRNLLFDLYKDNDKEKEFSKFIDNLPTSDNFLKYFSNYIKHDILSHIKNEDETWISDMIKYLGFMNDINDLIDPDFLENQILNKQTFIYSLYEFETKGIGKGELLINYLFENSKIQGGSEDFDIVLVNDETYEIKDYISQSASSIRLGSASGGMSKFDFYKNFTDSHYNAKNLFNSYKEELKEILPIDFYELWEKMANDTKTVDSDYKDVLGAAIKSGEMSKETLNRIIAWHCFANDIVNNKYPDLTEKVIHKISKLEYAKEPEKIKEDFNDAPKQYFENVGNLNAIIIFRKDKIRISKADDLSFVRITESKFHMIEKDRIKNSPRYADVMFKEYKETKPDLSYANFFVLKQQEEHEKTMQKRYETFKNKWEKQKSKVKPKNLEQWLKDNPEPISEVYYPRLNERFEQDSDSIYDMGIGLPQIIKDSIKKIFEEDLNHNYINPGNSGSIFFISIGESAKNDISKDIFIIHFYSNILKDYDKGRNNIGVYEEIDKMKYAIDLIQKVGLANYFYKEPFIYNSEWVIAFKIKEEYKKYFPQGWYSLDTFKKI